MLGGVETANSVKHINHVLQYFLHIMRITKSFSDQLQSSQLDYTSAAELIVSTTETLKEHRANKCWDQSHIYKKWQHCMVWKLKNKKMANLSRKCCGCSKQGRCVS